MASTHQPTARAPTIPSLTTAIRDYAIQQARMIHLVLGGADLDEPTRQTFEYLLRNVNAVQRATDRLLGTK